MNKVHKVSSAVLLLTGLAAMVLGARIGSAPDVFAFQLGLSRLPADAIVALARLHGGSLLGLGLVAIAAAFLSPVLRWLALALLVGLGLAAWFTVWQFDAGRGWTYAPVLKTLALADLLALVAITAVRDADREAPSPADAAFHTRWG